MRRLYLTTACLLVYSCVMAPSMAQQGHGKAAQSSTPRPVLVTPPSLQREHQHLQRELATALESRGKTAEAAKEVEAILAPHFAEEEAYAMPLLGLLEPLARGQRPTAEQVREAVEMSGRLRTNYDRMLAEHRKLATALQQFAAAAEQEKKGKQAEFAEVLMLHAQNEEQVLYPAALLVGDYLKLKSAAIAR